MKSALGLVGWCLLGLSVACAPAAPVPVPTSSAPATPTAASLPSPAAAKPSPAASPSPIAAESPTTASAAKPTTAPAAKPTSAPASAPKASALPTVERSRTTNDPSFLTRIDLDLEFEQQITSSAELERVVDGILGLEGVVYARADEKHLSLRFDSQRVLPDRIRDRLRELGHPATAGVDVQNPGDAAD
jgi:hypothetical protein